MNYADFVQLAEADKEAVLNKVGELFSLVKGDVEVVAEDVVEKTKEVLAAFEAAPKGPQPDAQPQDAPAAPADGSTQDTSGVQTSSDLK